MVDANGNNPKNNYYYSYGDYRTTAAAGLTDKGFTGQTRDASTGLYYYSDGKSYGRYYDPSLGRWLQPDTVVPATSNDPIPALTVDYTNLNLVQSQNLANRIKSSSVGSPNPEEPNGLSNGPVPNPQMLNRYAYVANRPLTWDDPDGHGAAGVVIKLGRIVVTRGKEWIIGTRVLTMKEAQKVAKKGGNLVIEGGTEAEQARTVKKVMKGAHPDAKVEIDPPHGSSSAYKPHANARGKGGHAFFNGLVGISGVLGNLTFAHYHPDDWSKGEMIDIINPISSVKDIIDLAIDLSEEEEDSYEEDDDSYYDEDPDEQEEEG